MIFCDEPHCNEPSYERDRGSEQSKAYNRNVYAMTVKHAMLEWLDVRTSTGHTRSRRGRTLGDAPQTTQQQQPTSDGIWGEVVAKHFESHGDDILKTVDTWVADKPPPRPKRSARLHNPDHPLGSGGQMSGMDYFAGSGGHTLGSDGTGIFSHGSPHPSPARYCGATPAGGVQQLPGQFPGQFPGRYDQGRAQDGCGPQYLASPGQFQPITWAPAAHCRQEVEVDSGR